MMMVVVVVGGGGSGDGDDGDDDDDDNDGGDGVKLSNDGQPVVIQADSYQQRLQDRDDDDDRMNGWHMVRMFLHKIGKEEEDESESMSI